MAKRPINWTEIGQSLNLGSLILATIGGGWASGWLLDDRFLGLRPWGTIIGLLLGIALSAQVAIRAANRAGKKE